MENKKSIVDFFKIISRESNQIEEQKVESREHIFKRFNVTDKERSTYDSIACNRKTFDMVSKNLGHLFKVLVSDFLEDGKFVFYKQYLELSPMKLVYDEKEQENYIMNLYKETYGAI